MILVKNKIVNSILSLKGMSHKIAVVFYGRAGKGGQLICSINNMKKMKRVELRKCSCLSLR